MVPVLPKGSDQSLLLQFWSKRDSSFIQQVLTACLLPHPPFTERWKSRHINPLKESCTTPQGNTCPFQTQHHQAQLPDNEVTDQLFLTFLALSKSDSAASPYLKLSSIGSEHIPIKWLPSLIYWGFAPSTSMVSKGTALQKREQE